MAGDVLERKGHMDRDWRRIASMVAKSAVAERTTGQWRATDGVVWVWV